MRFLIWLSLLSAVVIVGVMVYRGCTHAPMAATQARLLSSKPVIADADVDVFLAKYDAALQ